MSVSLLLADKIQENSNKILEIITDEEEKNKVDALVDFLQSTNPEEIEIDLPDQSNRIAMVVAVITQAIHIIRILIRYGARIDIIDSRGKTLLYYSITLGYDAITDLFLTENKRQMGISILSLVDKDGYTALSHACVANHYRLVEKLISHGANVDTLLPKNKTVLHMCIMIGWQEGAILLMGKTKNINAPSDGNLTPLHLAVYKKNMRLVKELINHHASISIRENKYSFTPVLLAIQMNIFDITNFLLDQKPPPNQQDTFGNTILHYAVRQNNHELIQKILTSYSICQKKITYGTETEERILPNVVNSEGKTVLHMHLVNNRPITEIWKPILTATSLNLQDSNGVTALMMLVNYPSFPTFRTILRKKKLDAYLTNHDGQSSLMIAQKNSEERYQFLLGLLSSSYLHQLKKYPGKWDEEWENKCSIEKEKQACLDQISQFILEKKRSIPKSNMRPMISLVHGDKLVNPTYQSTSLEVAVGFRYLEDIHSNCSVIFPYQSNSVTKLPQFRLLWENQTLIFPPKFTQTLMGMKLKRFLIIPLIIQVEELEHANSLVYDSETNEMERFDSHGSGNSGMSYNPKILDAQVEIKMKGLLKMHYSGEHPFRYFPPCSFIPTLGFQYFDAYESSKDTSHGDPDGFCLVWNIWYLDQRLTYTNYPRDKLITYLLRALRFSNNRFRSTIRNYSFLITDKRDALLADQQTNMYQYSNHQLTSAQMTELAKSIFNH